MDKSVIFQKICKWCAYQDRSEFETYQKLLSMDVSEKDALEMIELLKEENYLNQDRFLRSFINGKLHSKKWGLEKIKFHLKQKHHVPEDLINQYFQEINKNEYLEQLKKIIHRKKLILEKKEKDKMQLKKKIINFALSKGFDFSDIYQVINELKL
jgi:regulatory protein